MLALLASTFVTVFLAELGDKTQLAIVSISGTSNRPGAVFAGSSFALVLASLVGAAAGGSLSSVVPTNSLQLAAAAGFLIIGTRLILRSGSGKVELGSNTGSAIAAATATAGPEGGADEQGHDGEPTTP
ncbi:MAG: TMEM165/GDT1 family protein [Synechococcaceae cyanobacterium ELA263]